jgi:hypothetical protein
MSSTNFNAIDFAEDDDEAFIKIFFPFQTGDSGPQKSFYTGITRHISNAMCRSY